MPVWIIAEDPYRRTYHARCCSTAAWCCIITYIVIFILPFLMSNYQKNLWRGNYEVYDTDGIIDFEGNVVLIAGPDKEFSTMKEFAGGRASYNRFGSVQVTTEAWSAEDENLNVKVRIIGSDFNSFSGYLYMFVRYESNLLYKLSFEDLLRFPVSVEKNGLNVQYTIGEISMVQNDLYRIDNAVGGNYKLNSSQFYLDSNFNILSTYNNRLNKDFHLDSTQSSYKSSSPFDGFEINLQLFRGMSKIRREPTISDVLRNSWPTYLAFFIPIALFLRYILKEAYQYQLFPTTVSIKCGETMMHKLF